MKSPISRGKNLPKHHICDAETEYAFLIVTNNIIVRYKTARLYLIDVIYHHLNLT